MTLVMSIVKKSRLRRGAVCRLLLRLEVFIDPGGQSIAYLKQRYHVLAVTNFSVADDFMH